MSSTAEAGNSCARWGPIVSARADKGQSGRCPHRHARQPDHRTPNRAPAGHEDPHQLRQGGCGRARRESQDPSDVQGEHAALSCPGIHVLMRRVCRATSTPTVSATTFGRSSLRISTSSSTTRTRSTPTESRSSAVTRSVPAKPRAASGFACASSC
jgi:hypothetical protein